MNGDGQTVQSESRRFPHCAQSRNHLKHQGLAVHNQHDVDSCFSTGRPYKLKWSHNVWMHNSLSLLSCIIGTLQHACHGTLARLSAQRGSISTHRTCSLSQAWRSHMATIEYTGTPAVHVLDKSPGTVLLQAVLEQQR